MTVISVARAGQEIGDYNLEGINEGLASGYFLPDDWGWYDGLTEWLPVSEIVAKLSKAPAPPTQTPLPSLPPPVTPSSVSIKQDLTPRQGKVTYVLKETKTKKSGAASWRNDPATEKQIVFLNQLRAGPLPSNLTKGQAHDMIDARLSGHAFLTPKQMACLSYHGFDPSTIDYDEARVLLEKIHKYPESFDVPEPWATAKYHLYPKLYPPSGRSRQLGCLAIIVLIIVSVCIVVFVATHSTPSDTATPSMPPVLAPAPTPASSPPASNELPSDDSVYHGTADKDFGKDWVIVAGKKIEGITQVKPVPNGKVELIYSLGVGNFAASSLPQGFLDAWQITPERLKALNN